MTTYFFVVGGYGLDIDRGSAVHPRCEELTRERDGILNRRKLKPHFLDNLVNESRAVLSPRWVCDEVFSSALQPQL